jgi:RNA polymerase sigma-70 factor (sigma-E family)
VRHAGGGGEEEFAAFFGAQFAATCRYAAALTGDRAEGEEIAQQAFTRLYPRWARVRRDTAVAYLRKIVTRVFLDARRRSREYAVAEMPAQPVEADLGVVERAPLQAALLGLPPRQRAVLVLRFAYDLPVIEVAAALGCSPGTVKSHASRGLATLRGTYPALACAAEAAAAETGEDTGEDTGEETDEEAEGVAW